MATNSSPSEARPPKPTFTLLPPSADPRSSPAPRLGHLTLPSRNPISTPHYLALSSRGCVPHLTPDMMATHTSILGLYAGFEDYAESHPLPPPFYTLPTPTPLKTFIAAPTPTLLVLGPRRHPALPAAAGNTYTSLNINTSMGFRQMEVADYISAVERCGVDIAVGIVDVEFGGRGGKRGGGKGGEGGGGGDGMRKPGVKKREHMLERSGAWVRGLVDSQGPVTSKSEEERGSEGKRRAQIWAPILPLEAEVQRSYLEILEDGAEEGKVAGVVLYENASLDAVPVSMQSLPKLALTEPRNPGEVLDAVGLGVDLVTAPFVTKGSEAGVAFTFEFPVGKMEGKEEEEVEGQRRVLGVDMWDVKYAVDVDPLVKGCECYACKRHMRAYLHHLLQAKEMLAWVLLQVHNHHVMDRFFEGVRGSIKSGTFEEEVEKWKRAYESDFPEFVGQGPRIRGYQKRTASPGPPKQNKAPYTRLDKKSEIPHRPNDRKERLAEGVEAQPLIPSTNAVDLEDVGFAQMYNQSS